MRFHFEGKYDGNPDHLRNQRQVEGAIKFREPPMRKFAFIANLFSLILLVGAILLVVYRAGREAFSTFGFALAIISLFPHEYLHALCFKEDVYMYTDFKSGLLFVAGDESMSRRRFVFMSMLPNLVFGFIPFILFLIWPNLRVLGTLGSFAIAFGAGDYINVFNALTQMPRNAVTYLYRLNSYWYIPKSGN